MEDSHTQHGLVSADITTQKLVISTNTFWCNKLLLCIFSAPNLGFNWMFIQSLERKRPNCFWSIRSSNTFCFKKGTNQDKISFDFWDHKIPQKIAFERTFQDSLTFFVPSTMCCGSSSLHFCLVLVAQSWPSPPHCLITDIQSEGSVTDFYGQVGPRWDHEGHRGFRTIDRSGQPWLVPLDNLVKVTFIPQ